MKRRPSKSEDPRAATLESSAEPQTLTKGIDAMNSITTITPDNVPALTYDGKPVVTTAMLAKLYGTDEVRIRQNYTKNKDRFVQGKHCFKIEGSELKDLKNRVSQSYSVGIGSNARSVVLYTDRGAARHAKMLETDAAWDVFEKLEDNYFGPHSQPAPLALPSPLTPLHQREIQKAVTSKVYNALPEPMRSAGFKRIYSYLKDRFDVGSYKDIDDSRFSEALGAVQSYAFEGEWIEKASTPALPHLNYSFARWVEENPRLKSVDFDCTKKIYIHARDLYGMDSRSPTMQLLSQLEREGHQLEACRMEVQSMRHHLETLEGQLKRAIEICHAGSLSSVRVTLN